MRHHVISWLLWVSGETRTTSKLGVMRNVVVALLVLLGAASAFADEPPACFLGRWKSDEQLTLQDMRKHPEVSEKAKALFESHFFGRLVVIYGAKHYGAYFEGEQNSNPIRFEPYRVVEQGADWMVLRDESLGVESKSKLFCEGGRIYALVSKWEFKEYFSPLP